ncbi:MAG: ATP-grasp domain-containing protein [Bacteroidetes bacterium]|nr:ATP-grasp domain-containing protein [Bacteroidota bacterium]
MFILDLPYVSDFLRDTVIQYQIPVLKTPQTRQLGLNGEIRYWDISSAIEYFKLEDYPGIYSNSENAIEWVAKYLPESGLTEQIELFKNKIRFRELLQSMHPEFYFNSIPFVGLDDLDITPIPKPFIIKPSVGFFSLGVYKVFENDEWDSIKLQIKNEVTRIKQVYPAKVLDTTTFIIEQNIEGDEYAFDAYFDDQGNAVILSLLKHLYASDGDVSDRVYISSKSIIEDKLRTFEAYLDKIGKLAGLRNFPLHVEIRVDTDGTIRPIEINPMRFGGWCTTADMTWFAYGLNPYKAFYLREKPDWETLLKDKEGLIYSNIVLTNSTGHDVKNIDSFNYERLLERFEHPLELRKADFKNYLIFGFLFAKTNEANFSELEWILKDDLKAFIQLST